MEAKMSKNPVKLTHQSLSLKEQEKSIIKSMAGCFNVTFRFVETFSPDKDYKYDERYFESAKECTFIIEETKNKVSIQHILFVNNDTIIKHWRQDWIFENRELLSYNKDYEWKKIQLTKEQAKGTWTQKVYQVDDSPRYESYGTWIHKNGRHCWDSITDAPLPRRELKKRSDYNVINRSCRIEIFGNGGWQIEQDNLKVSRSEDNKDTLICMEKGLETFTPNTFDFTSLKNLWNSQKDFWEVVRKCWSELISENDKIRIKQKVANSLLFMSLFEMAEKFSTTQFDSDKAKTAIKVVIKRHVNN